MARTSLLHEWEHDIVKYSINVGEMMKVAKDIYDTAYARGKAQAQEKTGHWIKVTNGRGGHECDLCHEYAPSYRSGDEYLTKYCPNCGARMVSE